MKLGIGAAQFGMNYGISNRVGRTGHPEIENILRIAAENSIEVIDTAASYGSSEEALGAALPARHPFTIITKTPGWAGSKTVDEARELLRTAYYRSLEKLRQAKLYGLLFHTSDCLLRADGEAFFDAALGLRQEGLVQKVGVSVYTAGEIDQLVARFPLDLIQLPISVLDQRLVTSGHLQALRRYGIEIHARSVFLQGLLLMDPARLPPYFDTVRDHLAQFHAVVRQQDLTAHKAALRFVADLELVDKVVCGINDGGQLQELIADMQNATSPLPLSSWAAFALTDESILDPSKWKLN